MPTATVNEAGDVLYYEDSGSPPNSTDYSTVFLIHGYIFHAPVFRRLLGHANSYNMRFIAINMREYPGSSPLSDEQFAKLTSPDYKDAESVLRDQGHDIALFIAHFIQKHDIPLPQEYAGETTGGVSILAWSGGNAFMLSLLANTLSLDGDINAILERYMTTVLIYDVPCLILGVSKPTKLPTPFEFSDVSPTEIAQKFIAWASEYHEPFADIASITPEALEKSRNLADISPDTKYVPSSLRLSAEELQSITYPAVVARNPTPILDEAVARLYQRNLRRAVFDTRGAWEKVNVVMFWSNMTVEYPLWGIRALADMVDEPVKEGEVRRDVRIVKLENANHFLHFDEPERMARIISENIRRL